MGGPHGAREPLDVRDPLAIPLHPRLRALLPEVPSRESTPTELPDLQPRLPFAATGGVFAKGSKQGMVYFDPEDCLLSIGELEDAESSCEGCILDDSDLDGGGDAFLDILVGD